MVENPMPVLFRDKAWDPNRLMGTSSGLGNVVHAN